MPPAAAGAVLDAGADGAARLLDEHPAQALAWDVRALDAADAVTEQRVQEHHAGLRIAGSSPSLHLNLAGNYRRLGSFDAATEHINTAKEHAPNLRQDAYGAFLRTALDEVAEAISQRTEAPAFCTPDRAARGHSPLPGTRSGL
ncbi:hypothetical protein [Streptomyces sp. NPDC002913]